jgi:hypothetical protein
MAEHKVFSAVENLKDMITEQATELASGPRSGSHSMRR